ncbi:hypothetical protein SAMN05660236_3617 [Ohtaekwangia koreensis]|uniref:Uncharacterized protein n=1 Tax=Ohtaekwangia koreensis TaxID=688867 RepID=A0A1T5LP08_9BACT|nr:hypothetical protein SAMN05660236_3617 [Ohtaekwangia koreensis]
MLNFLFRLFLAFNSTALIVVVYFIKSGIAINICSPFVICIPKGVSYLIYIISMLYLTYFSLLLSKSLSCDSIDDGIVSIEYANDSFLPSYLGYFFVALD